MKLGTLYGIGVGPGDPNLVTVKGARILAQCRHVFVPKAHTASDSVALAIARRHLSRDAHIRELVFPMSARKTELARCWEAAARQIAAVLKSGVDACFLTLGDALLYSTYIYLLRAVRKRLPKAKIVTIPGITAFSAAAALTNFPVGEGQQTVTIVPVADDLCAVRQALRNDGTVVLMKIGGRLREVLRLLEETGLIKNAVFVAHAGQPNQRVELNLRKLKATRTETGYLSVILVHANKKNKHFDAGRDASPTRPRTARRAVPTGSTGIP